jgi:hypothetical protein
MFEVIHRYEVKVYTVYNVQRGTESDIFFLVFMNGYFVYEHASNFIPKIGN